MNVLLILPVVVPLSAADQSDPVHLAAHLMSRELRESYPGLGVHLVLVDDEPAHAIVHAAAAGAELVVVGSRGLGSFRGLLLGSVSQQCARRADCPVVIVHAPKPAATSPEPGEAAPMQRRAAA